MDNNERIAQWEKMTQADPANSMGWFSLGSAYRDTGKLDESAKALSKAIELDEGLSRAYQLLGQVLIQLNRNEEAARVLANGYHIAAARGDVMPQRAIGSLLEKLGKPLPEVKAAQPSPTTPGPTSGGASGGMIDRKTGKPGTRMPDQPMRGPLGKFIFEHFTQETWREWIGMGTKVINELRLDFSNAEHQRVYEQHMMEWLGISPEDVEDQAKTGKK